MGEVVAKRSLPRVGVLPGLGVCRKVLLSCLTERGADSCWRWVGSCATRKRGIQPLGRNPHRRPGPGLPIRDARASCKAQPVLAYSSACFSRNRWDTGRDHPINSDLANVAVDPRRANGPSFFLPPTHAVPQLPSTVLCVNCRIEIS